MKNLIILTMTFSLFLGISNSIAQGRRATARKGSSKKEPMGHKYAAQKRKRVHRVMVVHIDYMDIPGRGAILNRVHDDAIVIKYRKVNYRFHSGVCYKEKGQKWIVVRAPMGLRVKTLPEGYKEFVLRRNTYYYYYGTYYLKKDEQFEVVDPPLGAEINSLPKGYETILVKGDEYYEFDDVYYMPSMGENGEEILISVNDPNN